MKKFDKYEKRGAYHYDWYENNTFNYKDHIDKVLSYLPSKGSVLDIGCGDGLISLQLKKAGFYVTGIDTDEVAIRLAKNITQSGIVFHEVSIYEIDVNNKYDFIICHDVLEHLPKPEEAIQIMYEVCNDFCIITTPDADKFKPSAYDYQLWDEEGIKELFKEYRYEYIKIFDTFFIKLIKS